MKLRFLFLSVAGVAVAASPIQAQTYQRTATMRGGGNGSEGKCTIEVVVDGAAQVEVRGNSATLTNLNGQPPQWRRFECNAPLPANPEGFRFAGVDGRGRQTLIRAPRGGSAAVVQIDDPDNGSEGYTFDLIWGDRGNVSQDGRRPGNYPGPPPDGRPDYPRRGAFGADQAVRVCQDSIREQASNQYRTNDVRFRDTRIDDNPGRRDWVIGTIELRVPRRPDQTLSFSCSVDFASGRVRSAQLQPYDGGRGLPGPGGGDRGDHTRAIQNCERAAQQRLRDQGFSRITLGESRMDFDRGPHVNGDLRAYGREGAQSFRFSCAVEPRDGDVRSVDVSPLRR